MSEQSIPEQSKSKDPMDSKRWAHAPPHWTHEPGIYFVTASTVEHQPFFRGSELLDLLEEKLWDCLEAAGWKLQAWAVFPNHYHFVASHGRDARPLSKVLGKVHMLAAQQANLRDGATGRKVWFNYRDTQLTFENSWLARLAYVMGNPVKHGLVVRPEQYRWCSAGWFLKNSTRAFVKTMESFKTDLVAVEDPYLVDPSDCSDRSELFTGRHVGQCESGDMSPQSEISPQSESKTPPDNHPLS